jgi:hypothetical protein
MCSLHVENVTQFPCLHLLFVTQIAYLQNVIFTVSTIVSCIYNRFQFIVLCCAPDGIWRVLCVHILKAASYVH